MTRLPWGPVAGIPIKWSYADTAAREAESAATADHVGSLAWQLDDDSIWMLSDHDPLTWIPVSGGGGSNLSTLLTTPGDLLYRRFSEPISNDATATASSTATGDVNDVFDGPGGFSTSDPVTGQWIKADFGEVRDVGYARLIQNADGEHQCTEYLIEGSLDDDTWFTMSERSGLTGDEDLVAFSEGAFQARYVRMTAVAGGTGGWEVNAIVYGDPSQIVRLPLVGGRYLKSGAFQPGWDTMDIRDAINVRDEDYNDGDIFYYDSGESAWRALPVGTDGDVLTLVAGKPAWVTP